MQWLHVMSLLPDGWLEIGSTIEAPDELVALNQANLELWRRRVPDPESPRNR